jgi:hypothetical protein
MGSLNAGRRRRRQHSDILIQALAAFLTLLTISSALPASEPPSVRLRGSVVDEDGKPVAGLDVQIQRSEEPARTAQTDRAGLFEFALEFPGEYRVSLNKIGFFRLSNQTILLQEGENRASFTVSHEREIHEQVEVYSSSESIKPLETSRSDELIAREIRDIPVQSTHDLRSSLQVLPEVVHDNAGQLHISGGRTGETQYIMDGFDIGDPVTGSLSVRVNVDSVRNAEVESGRYGAQYGHAGAGVLSLDTTSGDDRWRAGATNFVPGVSAERGIHLTSWYPRLTLSGPLRKGRAWFSEALSVQHSLSLVRELPPNADSVREWAGDNMLRTEIKLAPKNILQVNFLYNQRNISNVGLGPFSPVSTTRRLRAYRSFLSLKEQVWSGRTFYEIGVAGDMNHSESLPRGLNPYIVTPDGSSGNHFESLREKNRRLQALGSISMPGRQWHGTHDLQFGFNAAELGWIHSAHRNTIEVVRNDNSLAQFTTFSGPPRFNLMDTIAGVYGHDVWRLFKPLAVELGLRADWDRVLGRTTASPRIAVNFLPFENRTKITAAWGVFLQPLTLSIFGPGYDQSRSDTFFGRPGPPPLLGPIASSFVFPQDRLKQPRFHTTSLGWEQKIGMNSQATVNFTERKGRFGLAYEKLPSASNVSTFILQNNRRDRYRSLQISFKHSFSDKTAFSWSYTRSSTWTNQVLDYSLNTLVFAPQQPGPLAWDSPNRLVSSGWVPAPIWNLFLSYFFEYRTGFPFNIVNEQQQLVGPANSTRLPDYASLNLGIEKRLRLFSRGWAVRLTIINVTEHSNFDSVINNVDAPDFMRFAGGQKRAYTARVRLVG